MRPLFYVSRLVHRAIFRNAIVGLVRRPLAAYNNRDYSLAVFCASGALNDKPPFRLKFWRRNAPCAQSFLYV